MQLSQKGRNEALSIARWALQTQICGNSAPRPRLTDPVFSEKRGAFVTLRHKGELRGCVGRVEPLFALGEEIADLALGSAVRDPRFPVVLPAEVDELHIEISILTPAEIVKDTGEIQTGRDGLIVEKDFHRGLLLPQVATEEGWGVQTFLEHTCLKAGLPEDAWKDDKTSIYRFSAIVFSE